ncbi:hypothetical protein [Candidatus Nitrospira salsa]
MFSKSQAGFPHAIINTGKGPTSPGQDKLDHKLLIRYLNEVESSVDYVVGQAVYGG